MSHQVFNTAGAVTHPMTLSSCSLTVFAMQVCIYWYSMLIKVLICYLQCIIVLIYVILALKKKESLVLFMQCILFLGEGGYAD